MITANLRTSKQTQEHAHTLVLQSKHVVTSPFHSQAKHAHTSSSLNAIGDLINNLSLSLVQSLRKVSLSSLSCGWTPLQPLQVTWQRNLSLVMSTGNSMSASQHWARIFCQQGDWKGQSLGAVSYCSMSGMRLRKVHLRAKQCPYHHKKQLLLFVVSTINSTRVILRKRSARLGKMERAWSAWPSLTRLTEQRRSRWRLRYQRYHALPLVLLSWSSGKPWKLKPVKCWKSLEIGFFLKLYGPCKFPKTLCFTTKNPYYK